MHCSLALWWVSRARRVVIIVHSPATRLARHVTTNIRMLSDRQLICRRSIVISLLRKLRLAWLFHDLVTIFVGICVIRFLAG